MSVNNLSLQLSWLLQKRPFVPGASIPIPTSGRATTSSSNPTADSTQREPDSAFFAPRHDVINTTEPHTANQHSAPNPSRSRSPLQNTAEMARLRTGPSPARKPRLLGHSSAPDPKMQATLEGTSSARRGASDGSYFLKPPIPVTKSINPRTAFPRGIPPTIDFHADPVPQSPKASSQTVPERPAFKISRGQDVDTVDLTDDLDGSKASSTKGQNLAPKLREVKESSSKRPASPSKSGRKRKSSEYEHDLIPAPESPRRPAVNQPNAPARVGDFAAIEDVIDDPPPPYSTHEASSMPQDYTNYFSSSDGHERRPSADGSQENLSIVRQNTRHSRAPNTLTPKRSLKRIKESSPPKPNECETSKRLHQASLAVVDSEDDEMEGIQPSTPKEKVKQTEKACLYDDNFTLKQRSSPAKSKPSPSKHSFAYADHKTSRHLSPGSKHLVQDEIVPESTKKPASTPQSSFNPDNKQLPPAELDSKEWNMSPFEFREDTPNAVRKFANMALETMQEHLHLLSATLESTKDSMASAIYESTSKYGELQAECKRFHAQLQACKRLASARRQHCNLSQKVRELKKGLVAASEEAAFSLPPDAPIILQNQAASKSLEDSDHRLADLIKESGLKMPSSSDPAPTSRKEEKKPARVAVQSSQFQPKSETKLQNIRRIGDFVQQSDHVDQIRSDDPFARQRSKTPFRPDVPQHSVQSARSDSPQRIRNRNHDLQGAYELNDGPMSDKRHGGSKGEHASTFSANRQERQPKQTATRPPTTFAAAYPTKDIHEAHNDHDMLDDFPIEDDEINSTLPLNGNANARRNQRDSVFDDYDLGDNDDDYMLEIAQDVEQTSAGHATVPPREPRNPLTERTTNPVARQATVAPSPASGKARRSQNSYMSDPRMRFPWSEEIRNAMRARFHLRGFRPNQLEAVNATLEGEDVFVLMPTGGGKSLCYQLPAVIQGGKTRGVTIVISPLLSLMEDQQAHLRELNIQAFLLNSDTSPDDRQLIYSSLKRPDVGKFIQILYVTPEMLSKSTVLMNTLRDLNRRRVLARMVIDEAHCVSQWGHDFRPDYKDLGIVRAELPHVPVMALTATATENVKVDVMQNLNIDGCKVFTQSFNRPNLKYEVRRKEKGTDTIQEIAEVIEENHRGQCGIIYCLARKDCENLAELLNRDHGINALHYHAGMEAGEKKQVQRAWQNGDAQVIVATIAFGMGIDKADVRFVIHHSMPKSLEGYYQETGRAGRDGKASGCYLYYNYGDSTKLKHMIGKSDGGKEQKERQMAMLQMVVQFCENKNDCRRAQVLQYFGERFSRGQCQGNCDNCSSSSGFEMQDYSDRAATIINIVRSLQASKVTLLHCIDVYRGGKSKKVHQLGLTELPEYGLGADLERGIIDRLFQALLSQGALREENSKGRKGFVHTYLKVKLSVVLL